MPWGPDVETNLAISSANHLKVRFIQQSPNNTYSSAGDNIDFSTLFIFCLLVFKAFSSLASMSRGIGFLLPMRGSLSIDG
nr:hypothetical protein [Arsenophonus endosymbiont of Aphis craccivora]